MKMARVVFTQQSLRDRLRLPYDALVMSARVDNESGALVFLVRSERYPDVAENCVATQIDGAAE